MGGEPALGGYGLQCLLWVVGSLLEQRGVHGSRVIEDGELVVGGSTVCVGSANLTKSEDDAATARINEVDRHTQSRAGHQLHAG